MAFQAGKAGRLRLTVHGIAEASHAVQALPTQVRKNAAAQSARSIGTLSRRADSIFQSNIKRPSESGEHRFRGGGRQTGNFTFGRQQGGTFSGNIFKDKNVIGFGWPNIDKADRSTKGVWRVLEYGLAGTRASSINPIRRPQALLPENRHLVPSGVHKMPKGFQFTTKSPATSVMYPARASRSREAAGIEGKHFIEGAWLLTEELFADRFKKSVLDAVAAFGK